MGHYKYGITSAPNLGERRVVHAALGFLFTCLVLDDGSIRLFGDDRQGQSTAPDLGDRLVVQAACGKRHTCLLLDDGSVRIFGETKLNGILDF